MTSQSFEIFLVAPPGLEPPLLTEAHALGLQGATAGQGGVTCQGGWADVWRANLFLRTAVRVVARIGGFRAMHLAQLDKRARKFDWGAVLRPDVPVRVETTCKSSRIYHDRAATQRIETALRESHGLNVSPEAELRIMARIEDDFCSFSLDTSGAPLHKRGHKEAVNKAPMRETMAAAFLAQCGYDGTEPVVDPMCGSGTFVIEAAEIAMGLHPGRSRSFAFEQLASFDAGVWAGIKAQTNLRRPTQTFHGMDRDQGAINMSNANAERAGVTPHCAFTCQPISDLVPPEGPKGLVIVNPPYGGRVGNRKLLFGLYGAMGNVLNTRFKGWRFAMVTSDPGLAKATGLRLDAGPDVAFGGLRVKLYQARL